MLIEKNVAGAWVVSDIIDGHRVSKTYYGYTQRQAEAEFIAAVKWVENPEFD